MKKIVVSLLKITLSMALVIWLLWDALNQDPEAVYRLRTGAKNWWLLAAAAAACTTAVLLTLVRWYYLVRVLGLPFHLRDSFRIGFVGYLFNLAPMGIVGGDLLKAWMLAREHRGHKPEAVASIIVDRLVGLYMLFVLATIAIVATGFWATGNAELRYVCQGVLVVTAAATLGILVLLGPQAAVGKLVGFVGNVPQAGPPLERLIVAVRIYRHKVPVLLAAGLISLAVHSFFTTGIHLIAHGLPGPALPLSEHFVVSPLGAATNIIPLPAGPQEGALKFLYDELAAAPLKGLIISLVYRIISVMIAAVGIVYYLISRREVAEVLHEAGEQEAENSSPSPLTRAVA